jgi:hypothetical protein
LGGDTERARDLSAQATQLGRTFAEVDLEMMGSATEGLALVFQGEVDEGISRLSQATAAGFEVTEVITLPDGPPLWCMWRTPRP